MHLSDYMAGKYRNGRVWTDDEVAGAINRSRVTVSRIRRRIVRPDWETIRMIKAWSDGVITADDFEELAPAPEAAE